MHAPSPSTSPVAQDTPPLVGCGVGAAHTVGVAGGAANQVAIVVLAGIRIGRAAAAVVAAGRAQQAAGAGRAAVGIADARRRDADEHRRAGVVVARLSEIVERDAAAAGGAIAATEPRIAS